MPPLINPLGTAILTRGFWVRDPIYYLGVHLAGDYIKFPTRGVPVMAAGDGWAFANPLFDFYRGWMVKVSCDYQGWLIGSAHMLDYAIPVNQWVRVRQGDVLGRADNTGASLGDHVHVDCWNPNKISSEAVQKLGYYAHDPELYLAKVPFVEEDMTPEQADKLDKIYHWLTDGVPFPASDSATLAPRIAVLETVYRIFADDIDLATPGVQPRFALIQDIATLKTDIAAIKAAVVQP